MISGSRATSTDSSVSGKFALCPYLHLKHWRKRQSVFFFLIRDFRNTLKVFGKLFQQHMIKRHSVF